MKYKIIGQTVPVVEMLLNTGETVYTQSGGMAYQSEGIEMKTNTRGGLMKGIGRAFSGESIFLANYTAKVDNALIAFASTVPGAVLPLNLSQMPNGFILKLSAALFGGEGLVLQKATGNGMLFIEVDGDVIEKELQPGEVLKVDTGSVVGFDPSVSYEIETVKGLGNIFLGGEGLFLTKLTGPGKVILQSQNFNEFAGKIIARVPHK